MSNLDESRAEIDLSAIRAQIEQIDRTMVDLLAQRVALARTTGQLKRAAGTFTLDPEREAKVVRRAAGLARGAGLDEEAVRAIFWQMIGMARRVQEAELQVQARPGSPERSPD